MENLHPDLDRLRRLRCRPQTVADLPPLEIPPPPRPWGNPGATRTAAPGWAPLALLMLAAMLAPLLLLLAIGAWAVTR